MTSAAIGLVLLMTTAEAGQRPAIGARAPLPALRDVRGVERPLKTLAGPRGLAVLFWAAWSERSVEELRRLDAAAEELVARGVGLVAVSVERYGAGETELAALRQRVASLGLRVPVLVDQGLELFHAYGVVTVPSTAIIDGNGKLAYFLYGYSHEQREELFDALDRLAGIERRRESGRVKAAPAALRRLQFGRLQLAQGRVAPARSSFETAAGADRTFPDPLVELAAIAIDELNGSHARQLLDRAAALDPGHPAARRERARLLLVEQRGAEAHTLLLALAANGSDPVAAAYLGYALQVTGDHEGARAAFERAKAIGGEDPRAVIPPGASHTASTMAAAMTAYRRKVSNRGH
jgi:tetratricopeptide (TPR) repeat protein